MNKKLYVCGLAVIAFLVIQSCSKSTTSATVNLSGTLKSASSFQLAKYKNRAAVTVAGAVVECITLAATPASNKGTADSGGKFTVALPSGVPVGCFVLSASDGKTPIAVFYFTGASSTSTSASFASDTGLGTVTVDSNGNATTTAVPSSATLVTSGSNGDDCLSGMYSYNTGSKCQGIAVTYTASVYKDPSTNTYKVLSGEVGYGSDCHTSSTVVDASLASDGKSIVWTSSLPDSTGACTHGLTVTFTPTSSCGAVTDTAVFTNCGTCGASATTYCDCGSNTCTSPVTTLTKQ